MKNYIVACCTPSASFDVGGFRLSLKRACRRYGPVEADARLKFFQL